MGTIYFATTTDGRYVKIGWTGGSASKRIATLQTGCPWPLDLFHSMPGSLADEAALHAQFAHLREGGEWFRFTGQLHQWLCEAVGYVADALEVKP